MKAKRFTVELTRAQVIALWGIVTFANHDADYEAWLKGAGSSGAEIRTVREVMRIVFELRCQAHAGPKLRAINQEPVS